MNLAQSGADAAHWRRVITPLVTPRFTLRELVAADAGPLAAVFNDPEVARHLTPGPTTAAGFEEFIDWTHAARARGSHLCLGLVPAGMDVAVGLFQIWAQESTMRTAEWGFALGRPHWGSGLFDESARLVLNFAFNELGIHRLESRVAVANIRGHAALAGLGAVREGLLRRCFLCDGDYQDHVLWAILADEWRALGERLPLGSRVAHGSPPAGSSAGVLRHEAAGPAIAGRGERPIDLLACPRIARW